MNSNESNESSMIYPLDDLLFSFGYWPISVQTYGIIIPMIALIGCILCALSLWIFYKKKFSAPIYWYFRVINITNIIQLAFAIPFGICFSPKYIPSMDSYACAIVQCAYLPFLAFTSHFVAILEIAILFERIKIMNPFVKKHFTISPKKMILITFFPCASLISVYTFLYVPYFGGDFFYFDSNGIKRVNTFWFVSTSTLVQSFIGSILMIALLFIKDILTFLTTLILNIVSLIEFKNYIRNVQNEIQNSKKKNHIKLILIMCTMSIVERTAFVTASVYFLFSTDYIAYLLGTFQDIVFVVDPSLSFFVFYNFNSDFKGEFINVVKKFTSKVKVIPTVTENLNEN
jgi:hypothetical protein